ncbi:MAG: flagellar hook-associated protein FlgK [Myxococcota bacterium]
MTNTLRSALNLTRTSLMAQAGAVAVTGENINGADTPGYVRRSPNLEAYALGTGIAGGVQWTGTRRAFSTFAFRQLTQETASLEAATERRRALAPVENALAPIGDQTIGDRMAAFFAAVDRLSLTPDDTTVRAETIAAAEDVAIAFNDASAGLSVARDDMFRAAQGVTGEVNRRLERIAALNQKIAIEPDETSAKAELIDQRDELIREVSERIEVQILFQDNGTATVSSSGATLVEGSNASALEAVLDPSGAMRINLQRNNNAFDLTSRLRGGQLGGLLQAREDDTAALVAQLDQLAFEFTTAVNAVHTAGVDDAGNGGLELFTDAAGLPPAPPPGSAFALRVNATILADPSRFAAATAAAPPPGGNENALAISALQVTVLPGGGTPAEQYAGLTGDLGLRLEEALSEESLRTNTLAFAQSRSAEEMAVSIEEEFVNLSQFQRAFEASTRVLTVVNEMFDTVLQLG